MKIKLFTINKMLLKSPKVEKKEPKVAKLMSSEEIKKMGNAIYGTNTIYTGNDPFKKTLLNKNRG